MIDAPETACLVASVEERSPPVRTVFVQKADSAFAVTKGDKILAEKPHPYGGTIRQRDFFG
jgi:hypothetical protein